MNEKMVVLVSLVAVPVSLLTLVNAEQTACIDDSDCVRLGHKYSCFLYFCHNWVDPSTENPHCQADWQCEHGYKCYRHWNLREVDQGVCFTEQQVSPCENHDECGDEDFCCGRYCCSQQFFNQWKNFPCISDMQCRSWNTGKYCCNNNLCCDDRRAELQATTVGVASETQSETQAEVDPPDVPDTVTNEIPDITAKLDEVKHQFKEAVDGFKSQTSAEEIESTNEEVMGSTTVVPDIPIPADEESEADTNISGDVDESQDPGGSTETEADDSSVELSVTDLETTEVEPFFTFGDGSEEEEEEDVSENSDEKEVEHEAVTVSAIADDETNQSHENKEESSVDVFTEAESGDDLLGDDTTNIAEYEEPSVFTDDDFDRNKYLDENLTTEEEVRVVELKNGALEPDILLHNESDVAELEESSAESGEVVAEVVEESSDSSADVTEALEEVVEKNNEDAATDAVEEVEEDTTVQTSELVSKDPEVHRLDSADLQITQQNHTYQSPKNRPAKVMGIVNSAACVSQCRLCIFLLSLIEVLQLGKIS